MSGELSSIPTPQVIERIQDDLYDGRAEAVEGGTRELLARGVDAQRVMLEALVGGMEIVGQDFRGGTLFVPEVLGAARSMKAGMEILRPMLSASGGRRAGTMILGTVKGDVHDIGKNLVAMMLEGAGLTVIDLGINVEAEAFAAAYRRHRPDLVGMSALLTTTMPYMEEVIQRFRSEADLKGAVFLVGGAPLNDAFAEEIRADAYCRDASAAVAAARKFLSLRGAV